MKNKDLHSINKSKTDETPSAIELAMLDWQKQLSTRRLIFHRYHPLDFFPKPRWSNNSRWKEDQSFFINNIDKLSLRISLTFLLTYQSNSIFIEVFTASEFLTSIQFSIEFKNILSQVENKWDTESFWIDDCEHNEKALRLGLFCLMEEKHLLNPDNEENPVNWKQHRAKTPFFSCNDNK